ncbi:MAG: mechanosensitive ion channel family protein [Candidatus Poseidonia sp.]|uniref:mechanosensitive ion channel family protein n=1 Tax=Poseidonia sp. TaxID=2666344 RepID=UPI0030BF63B3|nr:mechanosensitive ion channel family protein [Poseidonia sp.]
MVTVDEVIDGLNGMDAWMQWSTGLILTVMSILTVRFLMKKIVLDFVKATAFEWDDHLYRPVTQRLYSFIFFAGLQLTMLWVMGKEEELNLALDPVFQAVYIILSTSLVSVALKVMVPVVIEKFSNPSSVTVSGSNSLIIFMLRASTWFGGLYLAMNELGFELMGLLASLAVFSLIIGLAMQQTLGNIINSFMLALDQPFEVGDRIEVDGEIGSVVSVGILSTKILTNEENLVVIPNNNLINSTVVNHARGGGDGQGRRISLVMDIGVEYDEDISHVKYTVLQLMRECPYVIEAPEPRVLLNELGDFAKVFRLYGWVEDYSDEFVAKDWLLKNIAESFAKEGIGIPFPTAVEISSDNKESYNKQRKATNVRRARLQMIKEDKALERERAQAKWEIEAITEKLKDPELERSERNTLEESLRELNRVLSMFEAGDN